MSALPATIADLISQRIDTFEKLEIVIALHAAPRATLTLDELCTSLKLPREAVREATQALRQASLVQLGTHADVQLLPPTTKDAEAVRALVALYADDRLTVIKALAEMGMSRIRHMTAHVFADAFVFRKKKDRDDG